MAEILVAEDDHRQAELIRRYAVAEGHTVRLVADGREAVEEIRRQPPDLLILDVMMPRMSGFDVCRVARMETDVPILILTARSSEDDLLLGFDLGADDYLAKPYSPRELMARTRTLLRRRVTPAARRPLTVADLTIAPATHEVTYAGRIVDCTPGEFALLEILAGEPGRVFTREQLLLHLHGIDRFISRRTIDVHVANLRRKLAPAVIRTVYGVGYSLPRP